MNEVFAPSRPSITPALPCRNGASLAETTRTFTLPNTVDQESVRADYDKGVLKVALAKKAEAKPKQIKVNVGSQKTLESKEPKGVTKAA